MISPWNWPYTMPAELIAPALAAGNTVVWTPAPSTALCAVALAQCIADADLPPGVFNLVTGPGPVVGDELARNPGTDAVGFIGSTATGPARRPGRGRQGGCCSRWAATARSWCSTTPTSRRRPRRRSSPASCAPARAAPPASGSSSHAAVRDEFVELLAARGRRRRAARRPVRRRDDDGAAQQRAGRGQDGRARRRRGRARRRARSRRPASRRLPDRPLLAADDPRPTSPPDARVAIEETFGPIAPVVAIDSLEHAIALTNASPYGLLAAIFTADLQRGLRVRRPARTGWVNINESTNYWEAHLPFGGRAGSDSGIGRVGGDARDAVVHRAADRRRQSPHPPAT